MSGSESTTSDSPALGSRENYWGGDAKDVEADGGHSECDGVDDAAYIARQLVLDNIQPVCAAHRYGTPNRGFAPHFAWLFDEPLGVGSDLDAMHAEQRTVELSDPAIHLPKQRKTSHGFEEYRQVQHRRRYNPETGYINWGESTATEIPEFGEDRYWQAIGLYLIKRYSRSDGGGLTLTNLEDYVDHAGRLWSDPTQNSHGSLTEFVRYVRDQEEH